jgi:hypothetical protein
MRQILPRGTAWWQVLVQRLGLRVFRVIRGSFCFRSDSTIHESHESLEATVETHKNAGMRRAEIKQVTSKARERRLGRDASCYTFGP